MDRRARLDDAGRWLKQQREQRRIAVRDLAAQLNVLPQTVYNWEAGKSGVDDETADRIAEILDLGIITTRRGLRLWVPPPSGEEQLKAGDDDDMELRPLVERAIRERDAGDPWLYETLLRLQRMNETPEPPTPSDDERAGGTQQAG